MSQRIIADGLAFAILAVTMVPMSVHADSPEVNIWILCPSSFLSTCVC